MFIVKMILCCVWLIIIPTFAGGLLTRKMEKYKNSIVLSLILGYMIEFAVFEFLSLPISLLTDSFHPLFYGWLIIILCMTITSIKLNLKRITEILKYNIEKLKKLPIVLSIIAILLIALQAYIPFKYMHLDDDDSNFVAKATVTYQTNTLYKYNDIGEISDKMDLRHELATFPIYTALISKLIHIHPAVTAHTIFPALFIPLAYLIYTLIANNLFDTDSKKVSVFLIFLSFIYIWGFYSLDTNFCFLLYRIWQGKAILANIAIPLLWLLYLEYSKNNRKNAYWIAIFVTVAGSCVLSSMSIALIPVALFALTLAYFIKDRKILDFVKSAVSILPCVICAVLYWILK